MKRQKGRRSSGAAERHTPSAAALRQENGRAKASSEPGLVGSPAETAARSSSISNRTASFLRAGCARDWLPGLLLVAATLVAYSPVWFGKPIWDDDAHITQPELRSFTGLARTWIEPGATQQYYPLVFSVFWLEHRLWGDSTLGYHLVNILLHASSALLLLRILRRLALPGAWLAAAIFALHPIQVESVAWMTELKNTLSGLLVLSSVWAYLRFDQTRRRRWWSLAAGLFALGLTAKTAIATLPAGLLVLLWWQRGALSGKTDLRPLVPFFAAGLLAGLFTAHIERKLFGAEGGEFNFSFIERCLIAGHSLWFHLGKLFWPANLAFMYERWAISQAVWWQYLYPGSMLLLLAGCWAVRRWSRGPLAAVLWFAGMLFPALGFFNAYSFRYSFVNDHHQYLACLGMIVLVSAGLAWLLGRWGLWGKAPGHLICLALVGTLAGLTWQHARVFRDDESLWRDTLAKNPGCWMAHHNWAHDLAARGQLEAATEHYRAALRLNPDAEAHLGLGAVLDAQGKTDEALAHYLAAVQAKPDFAEAYNNLSSLFVKRRDAQQALGYATEAIRLRPNYAQAHYNLGNALLLLGQITNAVAQYSVALRLQPDYAEAHYNLGGALFLLGSVDEAAPHFAEAVRLQPANAAARSKLASVLARQGRTGEALDQYQAALQRQPELLEALKNLAWILATHRDAKYRNGTEAVRLAHQAVRLTREEDAVALDTLAAACAESGDFAQAVATAERALRLATALNQAGLREQLEARLTRYRAARPWRE